MLPLNVLFSHEDRRVRKSVHTSMVCCFLALLAVLSSAPRVPDGADTPSGSTDETEQNSEEVAVPIMRRRYKSKVGHRAHQEALAMQITPWTTEPTDDKWEDQYPPDLITKARAVLGGRIRRVWDAQQDWSSRKVFVIRTTKDRGTFMERNGQYVRLDSGAELLGINEVLSDFTFTRSDFSDPGRLVRFLSEVMFSHHGPEGTVASGSLQRMGWLELWLRGNEKDESVLKKLCEAAEVEFDGDVWRVVFNTIRRDGGADQWELTGRHDPDGKKNEIWNIEVTPIKPPGTFSWALIP